MANNDYWAYLREQRELRNDELMHYRVGGERSGYTKYPDKYKPVGDKAQAMLGSVGRYIGNVSKNIKNAVSGARNAVSSAGTFLGNTAKSVGNKIGKGIHDARTIIRNNIAESKRTSYGDMKNEITDWIVPNEVYKEIHRGGMIGREGYGRGFSPDNNFANKTVYEQIEAGWFDPSVKGLSFDSFKERVKQAVGMFRINELGYRNDDYYSKFDEEKVYNGFMDYLDKKYEGKISALKKASENAEREARNKADPTYNDSARPQDAMKEGQAKARQEAKERQEKARKEAEERKKKEEEAKFKAEAEKFDRYIKSTLSNKGITKDSIRQRNILRKQLGMPQLGSYEEVLISKIPEILPYFFGMKPSQKTIDKYTEYFKDLYGITYKEDT